MQTSNGLEFQSIEEVGREDILGFPSTKYKTRFSDNDGKGELVAWLSGEGPSFVHGAYFAVDGGYLAH